MSITEGLLSHVTQSDRPFTAAVHKLIAVDGVEDGGSDHLCQLLHVGWLNVYNV